jgi:hypothetical protein
MKYIIPRNKLIPDPSFEDILNSGALIRDEGGTPVGQGLYIYRGSDPRLPNSALIPFGKMFLFQLGMIYLPDKVFSLLDHAKEPFEAVLPLLSFGLGQLEMAPEVVLMAGEEAIGHALSGGIRQETRPKNMFEIFSSTKPAGTRPMNITEYATSREKQVEARPRGISEHKLSPGKQYYTKPANVSDLVNKGALYLPGVQIVEIEHQMIPTTILRRKIYRALLTYERLDGQRASYTIVSWGPPGPALFAAFSTVVLASRGRGEFAHLVSTIKTEQTDAELVWASYIEQYKARYGEDWRNHIGELITGVNQVVNERLQQKGFTEQRIAAEVLERLAPLIPHYQQVPELKEWVRITEQMAGNQQVSKP